MKAKVFACYTMADEISRILPPDIDLELLPYALHRTPQKLQSELQQRIDADTAHDTLLFGTAFAHTALLTCIRKPILWSFPGCMIV